MPPVAPPPYSVSPRHDRMRLIALVAGLVASVIVCILLYEAGYLGKKSAVTETHTPEQLLGNLPANPSVDGVSDAQKAKMLDKLSK